MHRPILTVMALSWAPSAAAADCTTATTTEALEAQLDAAEVSFGDLDVEGFKAATDRARRTLPCVEALLPRHLIARWHRFQGLRGFVDRDTDLTLGSFAAARSIQPEYTFPIALVPAGHPVLSDYTAVNLATGTFQELSPPAAGRITVDGRTSLQRPLSWPTVVQLVEESGRLTGTYYLRPTDSMPSYAVRRPPPPPPQAGAPTRPPPDLTPIDPRPRAKRKPALAVASGIGLGLAGGMWGVAIATESKFKNDEDLSDDDLARLRRQANGLTIGAGVTAGISVGLGIAFVQSHRF